MKYLLISKQTAEQTICDKVAIDGFDYYVCNKKPSVGDKSLLQAQGVDTMILTHFTDCEIGYEGKKIIATNNPNLDIPQLVDEVEELANKMYPLENIFHIQLNTAIKTGFQVGYHKSQETHPFSEEDADAYADAVMGGCLLRAKEWKEQQPKKVYYTQTTEK